MSLSSSRVLSDEPTPTPVCRIYMPATSDKNRCAADGTWFACADPQCVGRRKCASDAGLLHCACPIEEPEWCNSIQAAQNVDECSAYKPKRKGRSKCAADGLWYSCDDPLCGMHRGCASDPGLKYCACPKWCGRTPAHPRLVCRDELPHWCTKTLKTRYAVCGDGQWSPTPPGRIASCPLKQTAHHFCSDRIDSLMASGSWRWPASSRCAQATKREFGCLRANETLCIVGDSLARHLFVDVACRWAEPTSLVWHFDTKVPGKTYVWPETARFPNGATMRYFAPMFTFSNPSNRELKSLRSCSSVVVSRGAWHVDNQVHRMQSAFYDYQPAMEDAVRLLQQELPSARILLKPTYAFGPPGKNDNCSVWHSRRETINEVNNMIIRALNRALYRVAVLTGVEVLGGTSATRVAAAYTISASFPCAHPAHDVVHSCEHPQIDASMYKAIGELLSAQLCLGS